MKRIKGWGLLLATMMFANVHVAFASNDSGSKSADQDRRMHQIFAQGAVLNQGIDYSRQFKFDLAFSKMLEATQPKYLIDDSDKSYPLERLADLHRELGLCSEANKIYDWHRSRGSKNSALDLKTSYLKACSEFQQTGNKQPIYDFIEQYKKANKDRIPPKWMDPIVFSVVAELYDLVGDYDAGIAWGKLFRKRDDSQPLKKTRKEYDGLIQAFEESKRGMQKVCSEDGKYCVGRATAYIIRSKYF